jgi:hypothetical protein
VTDAAEAVELCRASVIQALERTEVAAARKAEEAALVREQAAERGLYGTTIT